MGFTLALGSNMTLHAGSKFQAVGWLSGVFLLFLQPVFLQPANAANFSLVIVGLGGDEEYREKFETAGSLLNPVMTQNENVSSAATSGTSTGSEYRLMLGDDVTLENILAAITEAASTLSETDQFVLTLLGHGSYDGEHYRFNIKGADLTDAALAAALESVKASRQLVVVATSASGAALEALEAPTRVVITATKSGGEINAVTFPTFWSQALTQSAADVDHNELLTAREAFDYTAQQIELHYSTENLMATEHPRLLGKGDNALVLARLGSLKGFENNPAVNRLLDKRAELEIEFNAVKARKPDMTATDYLDELERVLLDIARLQQQIDQETGWDAKNG